ncbi:WASH complex subunit 3 [Bradysia coprophila]|uniref:WASH complex subunit 3 n=1 Tax=Bradysia coprophila TaxID=38358 RepID=UPI00187D7648|nr:WASH complex subunit 3 [Bradysia coprophila]
MESTITSSSLFDADFDKSQLPPIDQKRLVTFINHFLIDTTKFLNSFLVNCENKFVTLESRLQKINSELTIIESKVFQGELKNAVPVDDPETENQTQDTVDQKSVSDSDNSNQNTSTEDDKAVQETSTSSPATSEETGVRVCEDARYDKYFKMKQFGVPAEAVKLKMSAEGLDPSLLDQPNRILEDGVKKTVVLEDE